MKQLIPKQCILQVEPYTGGNHKINSDQIVNLASNESAIGPSPKVIDLLKSPYQAINRYPDGSALLLRRAISEKYKIEVDKISCGAGSDELIDILVRSFAGVDDEVLYSQYGFLMYPIVAKTNGSIPVAAPEYNFRTDIHSILSSITKRTKVILIANPNNPTGSYLTKIEIELLCREVPKNILIVIDSAYAEFVEKDDYEPGIEFVNKYENLVMTRTFSKLYGLAFLRLGWSYSSKYIAEIINKVRLPFNVNGLAQKAGIEALSDSEHEKLIIRNNNKNLSWLTDSLKSIGFEVLPSVANFILVKFNDNNHANLAHKFLLEEGILVRKVEAYGLPNFLRISVGKKEEVELLVKKLDSFIGN